MDPLIRSRVLMVTKVPKKLVRWWQMLDSTEQHNLKKKLGTLISLLEVTPRPDLIEAMITYWDPDKMVFRFGDCEMTPTLAEISGLARMPYIGKDMIRARGHSCTRFLLEFGLRDDKSLGCLAQSWISLDYLFARFGPLDSFEAFWDEFRTTKDQWQKRRLEAFSLALLGTLVFPLDERHINTRLQSVVMALFNKRRGQNVTIIPMILVEIYKALTEVQGGIRFFEGSNLLLQLWMIEHLRSPFLVNTNPYDRCLRDRVENIERRMRLDKSSFPVGVEAWIEFLEARTSENVVWAYLWLYPKIILVGCRLEPILVLIGLRCTRSYTPTRVMRQLGRIQGVPPVVNLRKYVEYFADKAQEEFRYEQFWSHANRVTDDNLIKDSDNPGCTQEYQVWIQMTPRGISRPLPAQLRGRAQEIDIVEKDEDLGMGAQMELLRVQLASLVTNVEGHHRNLFHCTLQEAGTRARAIFPNIKTSLQGMLHMMSSSGRADTSQPGPSQAGPSQPEPSHYRDI